jgi:hypothetical protein
MLAVAAVDLRMASQNLAQHLRIAMPGCPMQGGIRQTTPILLGTVSR